MFDAFANLIEACGTKAHIMRRAVVLSLLSAIAQGLAYALLFPLLDALVDPSDRVWWYFGALVGLVVLDAMFRFAGARAEWRIYVDVADSTRADLGEQLKQMPLEQLARRQTGDLNSVLTSNVNDVVTIAGGLFGMVVNSIVTPAVTVFATFFVDWRLAVAMLVLFPLAIPIYRVMRARGAVDKRMSLQAHADTASHIVEYTQGLAVLRATRQTGAESDRLQASLARLRDTQSGGLRLVTMPSIVISAIVQIGIVAVTALTIRFVLDDTISITAALAVIVITVRFSEPLALFANLAVMFDAMEAALDRIAELLDVQPLPTFPVDGTVDGAQVEFRDVSFTYEDTDDEVLHDISVTLPERSLTALVGGSGSGKTTVTRLLTRFADPQHGSITIDDNDLRTFTPQDLMRQFSVVFQDVYLFDDTIRDNIRLGRPAATDDDIADAARAANCHEFIAALPHGYNTTVGEIGATLSGGERQRISIARAILKDAPIVILDEPTSALDTESEVAVQQAIDTLVENKTVLVIAHRLSTIAAANNIIVLEEGHVVEHGTHTDLLERNGRYAELWSAQQAERNWQITPTADPC